MSPASEKVVDLAKARRARAGAAERAASAGRFEAQDRARGRAVETFRALSPDVLPFAFILSAIFEASSPKLARQTVAILQREASRLPACAALQDALDLATLMPRGSSK